jgi:hypothetical protein
MATTVMEQQIVRAVLRSEESLNLSPSNTPSILGRRALPAGRIAALDANRTSETKH